MSANNYAPARERKKLGIWIQNDKKNKDAFTTYGATL
ncbi:hypothetical protein GGU45_000230 [Niabella hirudinis]